MKCYNCGMDLNENDFCTACGADVYIYKKIVRLSNEFYNEGLAKAKVRDLSGAAESLRQSLKCYKYNTDARNLLGLVYFEMGDAVEALSEWVLSKNFQPKKNIADDFMDSVQNNPSKWDNIRQTIRKYNQALDYCRQDSLDLAIIQLKSLLKANPNMIRAYQLLTLLYINSEQWDKAAKAVNRAKKIDANNTMLLSYENEIEEALRRRDELDPEAAAKRKKKQKNQNRDVIEYTSGNETIIQPLNHPERAAGVTTVFNIFIGLVIGLCIMWYLVLPAKVKSAQKEANDNVVEVSNQLTEKSAGMDELQKRIDALEDENSVLMSQIGGLTGENSPMQAADALMNAARAYINDPEDSISVAESLEAIDSEFLEGDVSSEAFKNLYRYLYETTGKTAADQYLKKGLKSLEDNNYADAIEQLARAYQMDDTSAEALFNLAEAYRKSGEKDRASEVYLQVISNFGDTDFAKDAKKYVEKDDNAGEEANGNGQEPEQPTETIIPNVTVPTPTEEVNEMPAATDLVIGAGAQ